MESIQELKFSTGKLDRNQTMINWLREVCTSPIASITALPADASQRRYFRVQFSDQMSAIVMDQPKTLGSVETFIRLANAFRGKGLKTPEIISANIVQGFLLISDFGDKTYLNTLNEANADQLYRKALDALFVLKDCPHIPALSQFGADWMWQEWHWHQNWFLHQFLQLVPSASFQFKLNQTMARLVAGALSQPQVCMHRDFHSANLMVLSDDVGILDFQDAFIGPISYDLVSLLRDCYIDWPAGQVHEWLYYYYLQLARLPAYQDYNFSIFKQWFDWMGAQRHLKALLTFARKCMRDQDPRYIKYMPRTLNYLILETMRYPELSAMHVFYSEQVLPALNKKISQCEA